MPQRSGSVRDRLLPCYTGTLLAASGPITLAVPAPRLKWGSNRRRASLARGP